MASRRTAVRTLAALAALAAAVVPGTASATAVEPGYCLSVDGLVDNHDGSWTITNQVNGGINGESYDAGCVTTRHVPGGEASFVDAFTYPGWTFKVKDAGGKDGKVAVVMIHSSGVRISYTIQPGRIDWRISA